MSWRDIYALVQQMATLLLINFRLFCAQPAWAGVQILHCMRHVPKATPGPGEQARCLDGLNPNILFKHISYAHHMHDSMRAMNTPCHADLHDQKLHIRTGTGSMQKRSVEQPEGSQQGLGTPERFAKYAKLQSSSIAYSLTQQTAC